MESMDPMFRDKIKGLVRKARELETEHKDRIHAARIRHEASWRSERPDRVPVGLGVDPVWSDWYYKRKYGIEIGRLWDNPKLLVECELRAWIDSFLDFDDDRTFVIPNAVGPLGGVFLHPSIVRCRTVFPEDDFPWIDLSYRVFDAKEKIDDFTTPDIQEAGLMPEILKRLETLDKIIGDIVDVRILGGDGSPLQMAAYTRGISQLIRDMYEDPPIVHKLMRKMMDVYDKVNKYYEAAWQTPYRGEDIEGRFYDNPLSYFSPRLVETFVLPHYKEYAGKCGWKNWSFETQDVMDPFIELFRTIPIRTISSLVSSSDLRLFKSVLGPKRVRFGVFLAPGRLMLDRLGIEGDVKRIVNIMGHDGGWTFSSSEVDSAVPQENIQSFLSAAKKYGR